MSNYMKVAFGEGRNLLQGNNFSNIGSISIGGGDGHGGPGIKELDSAIAALGQTDPRDDRSRLITYNYDKTEQMEGACEWVLDNEVFKKWNSENRSEQPLVWVCDRQYRGKTTLAIFVSEHLEDNPEDGHWVLYYFCGSPSATANTAAEILKSFIFQLCKKKHGLAKVLYQEWQHSQVGLMQPHSIEALWYILQATVNASGIRRISCIIDGIDQCSDQHLEHFLMKLDGHFTRREARRNRKKSKTTSDQHKDAADILKLPELRVMILCRQEPEFVSQRLKDYPRIELEDGKLQHDLSELELYAHDRASKVSASCSKSKASAKEITDLVARALSDNKRDFLCVRIAAEKMINMSQSQVKEYVKQVPESVEDMHIQTLNSIPAPQRTHVVAVLKWVALAARPMSMLELRKAVKYTINGKSFSRRALKKALAVCHGLVQSQKDQVVLANQAVRELLFARSSPLRRKKQLKEFVLEKSWAHADLANACSRYLETSKNMDQSRKVRLKPGDEASVYMLKHPFLEYAIGYWTFHAKHGDFEKTAYNGSFFKARSSQLRLWWESYWISLRQSFAWKWTAPGDFSLLHIAAFFNIVPLARHLERQGLLTKLQDAEDHQGMKPINRAVERSSAAMVEFLLERGDFDHEALRQAARTGEVSIMEMLLKNRQERMRNPKARSPALSAAESNNPFKQMRAQTLNSISNWSKKIDSTDDGSSPISPGMSSFRKAETETPLHIAAGCGHLEAVKILLKYGEDPFKPTDIGWTALQYAAYFGRTQVAQHLIEEGVDGKTRAPDQLSPLHCAVMNNKPEVVECLLSLKAVDIEATDNLGYTAFQTACKLDNIPIMDILLDYGASINQEAKNGMRPLHVAAMAGHLDVVKWLVDKKVEVKPFLARSSIETGRMIQLTAVAMAKAHGHEGIVRLLEKIGPVEGSGTTTEVRESIAKLTQGTYNVPSVAVPQVSSPVPDGDLTSETPGIDDLASSSESDDDNEDGSDSEIRHRKQSTTSQKGIGTPPKASEHTPVGLGLDKDFLPEQELDLEVNTDTQKDMPATNEPIAYPPTSDQSALLDESDAKDPHVVAQHSQPQSEPSIVETASEIKPVVEISIAPSNSDVPKTPASAKIPLERAIEETVEVDHTGSVSPTPNDGLKVSGSRDVAETSDQPNETSQAESGTFSNLGERFASWRNDASEAGKLSIQKMQQLRSPKLSQDSEAPPPRKPGPANGNEATEDNKGDLNTVAEEPEAASTPKSGRSFSSGLVPWRKKSSLTEKEDLARSHSLPEVVSEENVIAADHLDEAQDLSSDANGSAPKAAAKTRFGWKKS